MPVLVTRHHKSRRAHAAVLSAVAAVTVALGAAPSALAATPVSGSYTLHYDWYSAGSYSTASFVLNPNGTCSFTPSGCTWTVSGSAFSMTFPNVRRGSVTYNGVVTTPGFNSAAHPGHMYLGTTGATPEGDWWAVKQ